ncbi:hypothetical protein OA381_00035 [Rhodospirillaceae bacterium]|nr:hypothetical protein [Rhodospirillaceae bacterium]
MKSLFAKIKLFLFICIVVHIATDVAAQQSPVSLLPKAQRTFEFDKKLPQEGSEIKASTESSNSESEIVQTNKLDALNLETTGILNIETGGFDKNMWNGTAHPEAISLLKNLPSKIYSRSLQNLQKRLLLTRARTPVYEKNENKNIILKLRLQNLFKSGKLNYFVQIQQNIPRSHDDEELAQLAVNVFFLNNNLDEACELTKYWFDKSQEKFWQKNLIFCDAINGLRDNVDFGIQLLSETRNKEDDKFISFINVIIGDEDTPSGGEIAEMTPRGAAMLRFSQQTLPKLNLDALPPWLHEIYINDPSIQQKDRLKLAHHSFLLGLLEVGALAKLYETADLPQNDIATAVTLASEGATQIPNALLYRLVLSQETDFGKAKAIHKAIDFAIQDGTISEMAKLYQELLKQIAPASELDWFACTAAMINMINRDFTTAQLWLEIAQKEDKLSRKSPITWSKVWPVFWLLNENISIELDEKQLEGWAQNLLTEKPIGGKSYINLTYHVLEIFGAKIPHERWTELAGKEVRVEHGYSLFFNKRAIKQALGAKRTAEAAANLLLSVGTLKTSEFLDESLLFIISTLNDLGLKQQAKDLAFQVLIKKHHQTW